MEAIDKVAPIKMVRTKAYSKPWFDAEIVLEVQKRDKLHWRYKKWGNRQNISLDDLALEKKLLFRGKTNSKTWYSTQKNIKTIISLS